MSENKPDPQAILEQLRMLAQQLVWKKPDVEVLRPDCTGQYSVVVTTLQDSIRASHQRDKLILPDLEAFGNDTVAIFSDYSGESAGNYYTYSFLTCALNGTGLFNAEMSKVREATGLARKEIAFKDFGMGQMQRALPEYLRLVDAFVPGFLLTVVVDKRLTSLFGPNERSSQIELTKVLREHGLGDWKPDVAEKLVRVVHIGAFLVGLLAASGQKVFWMTDNDSICANEELHRYALELFGRSLGLYTEPNCHFPTFGGAAPFKERHLETLDLLSVADVVAGSVEHYLTRKDASTSDDFEVKEGAEKVLQWLAHDGLSLKKMNMIIRPGEEGAVTSATLEFGLIDPPKDVTIVPVVI